MKKTYSVSVLLLIFLMILTSSSLVSALTPNSNPFQNITVVNMSRHQGGLTPATCSAEYDSSNVLQAMIDGRYHGSGTGDETCLASFGGGPTWAGTYPYNITLTLSTPLLFSALTFDSFTGGNANQPHNWSIYIDDQLTNTIINVNDTAPTNDKDYTITTQIGTVLTDSIIITVTEGERQGDEPIGNGKTWGEIFPENSTLFSINTTTGCEFPCVFKEPFNYSAPIITNQWIVFDPDPSLSPFLSELTLVDTEDKAIFHYFEFINEPIATMEWDMKINGTSPVFVSLDQNPGYELNDVIILLFNQNGNNDIKNLESDGSISTICTNCYTNNVKTRYKVEMLYKSLGITVFDNTTNLTTPLKANSFTFSIDGAITKRNINFKNNVSGINNINRISFQNTFGTETLLDEIIIYVGTNETTYDVGDLLPSINSSQIIKCVGGFCQTGGSGGPIRFDCTQAPECCGINRYGEEEITSGMCVLGSVANSIFDSFLQWVLSHILRFILLLGIFILFIPVYLKIRDQG